MLSREAAEAEEHLRLSPRASFSDATHGREVPLEPDPLRTAFQRDRDRIIHCKAFRRLSHKTQVFLAPEGDHYRTRLTHTLEVAQIARSIARALRLNEDLTEAIALGHDLGHSPFGHTGEAALSQCLAEVAPEYPGLQPVYEHNMQSLRVVEVLEYDGKGLNLTWEVRDGIRNHTGDDLPATLEGQIVKTADRIAYINHDIDDAVRAGVLLDSEIPSEITAVLGTHHGARITSLVQSMVTASADADRIGMTPQVEEAMLALRAFLFERVYLSMDAKGEDPKALELVKRLFGYYMSHPAELPDEFARESLGSLPQRVVDYVAGMTDRYAIRTYEQLFLPSRWKM
ncbi:MAG: deoxyguanosinetriphosphate triphosphohydrolase [Actinobacteria bacterium]|nr:MAG: deoxyguanosinetriphosphate triphosphohydrolase [Actinomycetota bacterium]